MWGIIARNRGMWGISTWCKKYGEIELFETKEEAQKVADKWNGDRINRFTEYFVSEYSEKNT